MRRPRRPVSLVVFTGPVRVESEREVRAPARFWFGAGAIYAVAVSAVLLVALLGNEGAGVALVLAVPAVLSALPVAAGGQRILVWGCIVLLAAFTLVSIASIGLFYLPAVAMLTVGATRSAAPKTESAPGNPTPPAR